MSTKAIQILLGAISETADVVSPKTRKFNLVIELGNVGMSNPYQVAEALTHVASMLSAWPDWPDDSFNAIVDVNGNTVGGMEVT